MLSLAFELSGNTIFDHTLCLLFLFFVLAFLGLIFSEHLRHGKDIELRRRIGTSLLIALVAALPLYLGGLYFALFLSLVFLYCLKEFLVLVHVWQAKPYRILAGFSVIALLLGAYLESASRGGLDLLLGNKELASFLFAIFASGHPFYFLPVLVIMLVLSVPIFCQNYQGMTAKETLTIFGILYLGWFPAHIIFLRNLSNGLGYVVYLTMLVVANDVFAYAGGRLFGKHALTPHLSPKKTQEGFVSGTCGSLFAAFLFSYCLPNLGLPVKLALALLVGITAPFGDLIVSVVKRDMGVKDSGVILPGHGGMLDRLGSLIFAAPNFYYFVLIASLLGGSPLN